MNGKSKGDEGIRGGNGNSTGDESKVVGGQGGKSRNIVSVPEGVLGQREGDWGSQGVVEQMGYIGRSKALVRVQFP